MAKIRYDHWHHLLGEDVFVTIGGRLFLGELVGLKALHPDVEGQRRVEWAWALKGARRTVYFDPDNPAVVVHRQMARSEKTTEDAVVARAKKWIFEADALVKQAQRSSERATELIERTNARLAQASARPE